MRNLKVFMAIGAFVFGLTLFTAAPTDVSAATASQRSLYSKVFDADYYYNTYPDVAQAFGNNSTALLNHYIDYGAGEGRSASSSFNVRAYKNRYSDLSAAFGNDTDAYVRHYINNGISEGRNAADDGTVSTATAQTTTTQSTNGGIGSCTTSYQTGVARAHNVELAAAKLNGTVVQPGQEFSFQAVIGPRSTAAGFVEAPIYVSGKHSTGVGGGVCQVSSTLYAAMINAGLPATERHAHSLPVTYLPAGYDATIAGNYYDLKFINIYSQPLLIQASSSNGSLTVTLSLQ